MAVAQEEAMDSVEGSHFANGRRHCCYQIGLEKTSKGFNEDVKNYLHIIFVYYSTLPDCARGRYKNIGQPFRKTTSLNKKHCAQLQKTIKKPQGTRNRKRGGNMNIKSVNAFLPSQSSRVFFGHIEKMWSE